MTERSRTVTVIGVGNEGMGDDGAGVLVVREIRERAEDLGAVVVLSQDAGMHLVRHFRESDAVVVVDAIDAGNAEAGAVFRFSPDDAGVTQLRSHNIHGMGLSYLVTNARLLGADPRVVVFGVQVGDVRPSMDGPSAAVAAVLPEVERLVLAELQSMLA